MLVLVRKRGDGVILRTPEGDVIRIVNIGQNRNGAVRLGIDAPADVNIVREELLTTERQEAELA